MGAYSGSSTPVDSSGWDRPTSDYKNGEKHPEASTSTNGQRDVTPDPYTSDNPDVNRNFGRK